MANYTCKCDVEMTGRCWLRYDYIIHESNKEMFARHGESSPTRIHAMATEELARLREKRWQMEKIEKIDSYPPAGVVKL